MAACGQSSLQSFTNTARWARAANQAVRPWKSGGVEATTTSGRGPESIAGSAESAKLRWFHSRVSGVLRGVA